MIGLLEPPCVETCRHNPYSHYLGMGLNGGLVMDSTIASAAQVGTTLICTGQAQGKPMGPVFPVVGDGNGESLAL